MRKAKTVEQPVESPVEGATHSLIRGLIQFPSEVSALTSHAEERTPADPSPTTMF